VISVALVCYLFEKLLNHTAIALILLTTVSLLAVLMDILPTLIGSLLSAVILNFVFVPPTFKFHLTSLEDYVLMSVYILIAFVSAILNYKIKEAEKEVQDKEEKEKTLAIYNTLLNSLSHELRTPIATIMGAVDNLKDNKELLSPQNSGELLTQISIATIRLNQQVENLLNMSRLETGLFQLDLHWTDVNELVYMVISQLNPPDGRVVFTPQEDLPICKMDMGLIEQIIKNLLSNALQYTPATAIIHISTACEHSELQIRIQDNGPGVPPQYYEQLYDKFFRVPHTSAGGTGLGLSIVKGFTEAHGGQIKAAPVYPHGIAFTVQIPVSTAEPNLLTND
jgi:two-component system sensor histidine kinase KdpD